MQRLFEYAAGSVMGTHHAQLPHNNQDAFYSVTTPHCQLHLVADGCGDPVVGLHSEVGAQIGVRIVAQAIERGLSRFVRYRSRYPAPGSEPFWQRVKQDALTQLYSTAQSMGDTPSKVIGNYFLFTLLGVLITASETVVFGIGDGVYCVNGYWNTIGPFPDNRPPYLSYNLLSSGTDPLLQFQLHQTIKTVDLQTFFIGTDGVTQLMNAASQNVPGEDDLVGPIEQFWQDEYFSSPYILPLRLKLLAQPQYVWTPQQLNVSPGLLPDDTTFIVGRRVAVSHDEEEEDA
jgi:hypothetical protein